MSTGSLRSSQEEGGPAGSDAAGGGQRLKCDHQIGHWEVTCGQEQFWGQERQSLVGTSLRERRE